MAIYRSIPIIDRQNIDAVEENISIECQNPQKNPRCPANKFNSSSVISNRNANGMIINPTTRSANANDAI